MTCANRTSHGGFQAFGPVAFTGAPLELGRPSVDLFTFGGETCVVGPAPTRRSEQLWLVSSKLLEIQRADEEPAEPLPSDQINTRSTLSWSFTSRLKLAIYSADDEGPDPFVIDTGHGLALYGSLTQLQVKILAPTGSRRVPSDGPAIAGPTYDAKGRVRLLALDHSASNLWAPLTQTIQVDAESEVAVRVPRGARYLRIYQTTAGPYPPAVRWSWGDPVILAGGEVDLGVVPWEVAGQRRTAFELEVPNASHLVFGRAELEDRVFTLVWRIFS